MGQMGPTEFVAILLISNAVQNSMNGGDNSLIGGMLLAAVLIFLSWTISVLTYRSQHAQLRRRASSHERVVKKWDLPS